jgi:hypothetical protein
MDQAGEVLARSCPARAIHAPIDQALGDVQHRADRVHDLLSQRRPR